MRTFYDILGISRSATQQEILVAYRKRCLETHPDKGGDGRDFMNVRKGYEILSNPEKRKAYDQWVLKKEKDELERKIKEQRVQNEEYSHKNASGNNSTRHYTSDNKVNSEKKDDSSILTYIIHSGFISGYQNRYGDNLKPPTNVYHRMTA